MCHMSHDGYNLDFSHNGMIMKTSNSSTTFRDVGNGSRLNVMPIVEIDLSKYKLVDNDDNIETDHKTNENAWKIEKK